MRVLFLTCHVPHPPTSGGRRRELELLRRLVGCDVELCVISNGYDADIANADAISDLCRAVRVFPAEARSGSKAGPPVGMRRYASPAAATYIAERLGAEAVDLVHIEGFYMAQNLPSATAVPRLLVEQNVEFSLWYQRAATASDDGNRSRLLAEAERVRRAEVGAWRQSDLVAALTEGDRTTIRMVAPGVPVRLVPDGADHLNTGDNSSNAGSVAGPRGSAHLLFVANFGYEPNVDAAVFLCQEIMPWVWADSPQAAVRLVGVSPPPAVIALAERDPRVTVTGAVPDVAPYLRAADVVVSPLRIGGGIKVKVLEALALGKAVVTTSVGAQGLPADTRAFWVEDRPQDFARAVLTLLGDARRRRRQERRAAALAAASLPTWDAAADALLACYRELLEGTATDPRAEAIGA